MTHLQARSPHDPRPHAVVIGSGFGGLAAAVRLGARGYRVTVLERLDAPGGRAYVFRQDGFTFDAGPTIVTAPFLLEDLWALCGRTLSDDVDLRPMDPFYRMRFHTGEEFNYTGDAEKMRAEVARFSPGDVAGYEAFMRASQEIYRVGFEQLGHVPFSSWTDMAKLAPQLLRLGSLRSVYGMVAKYVRDERLRTILSFHPLLVGGNPFSASSIYSLICFLERRWGVHFAMGGTGRIVQGLVGLIEGQGNQVACNSEVVEILVRDGTATGVRLANGTTLRADIVVSNACTAYTYKNLVPAAYRRHWTDRRIESSRYSMSLFVWYFGTRRQYGDVAHHTILLGPRYRELLRDIFKHHRLAEDFSLYLHRPTATDPSLAPEGCDAFYVLSPVPHLDSGTDWHAQAEPYRASIARFLGETVLPGLEGEIATSRMMTPIDFSERLLSYRGAAFGLEPLLTQSAWFRPHNASEDIEHLYIVGASTHPGAGLPGVLSSARILDRVVPDAAVFA
jgi:phytoene desaturase